MRLTAFLIGGVVGAAAAVWWVRNRGNLGSVVSVIGQTGQFANQMMGAVRGSLQEAAIKAMDMAISRGLKNEAESGSGTVQH